MTDLEKAYTEAYKKQIAAYLRERVKTDSTLREACQKENKSMAGLVDYVKQEAKKQAKDGCACIPDHEVYGWAVHYLLEDELNCEPKTAQSNSPDESETESETTEKQEAKESVQQEKSVKKDTKKSTKKETVLDEIYQLELF